MSEIAAIGMTFLRALQERDYPGIEACFSSEARMRAVVPNGFREAVGAGEATHLFRKWFGDAEDLLVISQSADVSLGRLALAYRCRVREGNPWQVVELHASGAVQDGKIEALDVLLCSGFLPTEANHVAAEGGPGAAYPSSTNELPPRPDAMLDAPEEGCSTLTPMIRTRIRALESGHILEVRTNDPTAADNLGAWSRLTGHELVRVVEDGISRRFFIRKK